MRRYAARVDTTQTYIVAALRAAGHEVIIQREPTDLLVRLRAFRNLWVMIECKTPGKNLKRKDQPEQVEFCRAHDIPRVTTAQEALDYVNKI
mgnify:CR=1 FL=1